MTAELITYVKEQNKKSKEWVNAGPGRMAGYRPEDIEFYHDRGIYSLDDLKRSDLISHISDGYKDVYGIRPRHMNFHAMSLNDLEKMLDSINESIDRQIKMEQEQEAIDQQIYNDLCNEYACSMDDLKRWGVVFWLLIC